MPRPSDLEVYETRRKITKVINKYEKLLTETKRYRCRDEKQLLKEAGVPNSVKKWLSLADTFDLAERILLVHNRERQCELLLEELEAERRSLSISKFSRETRISKQWIDTKPEIKARIIALMGTAALEKIRQVREIRATAKTAKLQAKRMSAEDYEQLRKENLAKLEAYARRTMNA